MISRERRAPESRRGEGDEEDEKRKDVQGRGGKVRSEQTCGTTLKKSRACDSKSG